jgi:hypothetical protein
MVPDAVPEESSDAIPFVIGTMKAITWNGCVLESSLLQMATCLLGSQRVTADDLQIDCLPRVATVLDLDPLATSNYLNERPCRVGKTLIWPA